MARFGAGRRRRATSTSRRSAPARPAPRTGCRATYATDNRPAGHVRGQAARPGRRGPRARRARLPLRGRVLHTTSPTKVQHPGAAVLLQRYQRRRGGLRPAARRHGARGAGRSDRGLHARRRPGWRWRRWPGCTARVGAIRVAWRCPAISMPKPGDEAAAKGLGDDLGDGRRHHDRQARRAHERRGPGNPQRGNGIGDAVADGRAETVRPDARRLPAGQHAVRSRPHTHHGGGLADDGGRPAGKGSGVFHRDQPGTRGASRDRARPGRPVSRGAVGLRRHGLRRRHLLARLPSRRPAGAAAQRARVCVRRVHRTRRRDDAGDVPPWLPGDPRAGNARADQQSYQST